MNNTNSYINNQRIHFGLIVTDLDRSIDFYRTLFQVEPRKVKADYAKFELDDPSINLALDLRPERPDGESSVTHFGIQVKSRDAIANAKQRLENKGWKTDVEEQTTCCYAEQSKIWATDPDGNRWEVFLVTDYDADQKRDPNSNCCSILDDSQPVEANSACC